MTDPNYPGIYPATGGHPKTASGQGQKGGASAALVGLLTGLLSLLLIQDKADARSLRSPNRHDAAQSPGKNSTICDSRSRTEDSPFRLYLVGAIYKDYQYTSEGYEVRVHKDTICRSIDYHAGEFDIIDGEFPGGLPQGTRLKITVWEDSTDSITRSSTIFYTVTDQLYDQLINPIFLDDSANPNRVYVLAAKAFSVDTSLLDSSELQLQKFMRFSLKKDPSSLDSVGIPPGPHYYVAIALDLEPLAQNANEGDTVLGTVYIPRTGDSLVTKFAAVVKRDSFGDGSYFADTLRFPLETYHPRIKADSLLVGLAGRFRPLPCTVQVGDTYALALLAENPGNETLSGIVASISMDIGYSSVESTARVVPSRDTVWILFSQPWVPLRPRVYWETGRLVWGSKEDSLVGQVQSLATGVEENPNRERDVEGEESSQSVMHSLSQTSIRLIQRGEYGLYNSLGQKVSIDHLKNGLGVWFLVPRTHKSGAPRKVVKI